MSVLPVRGAAALSWSRLPDIPDAQGLAGAFCGVSGGALVMAGGANIAGDVWADPLRKVWHDSVFVLEKPGGPWKAGFHLRQPCAYGVSVTVPDGVACFGGGDAGRNFPDAFLLRWRNGAVEQSPLPPLPRPCAFACGTTVGRTIYVAGGIESPDATEALHTFWSLDLAAPQAGWKELDPWPGPARILAMAGSADDTFFLFGGACLMPDVSGKKAVRAYLADAYAYSPPTGWRRLADLPHALAGGPSPAPSPSPGKLALVSGDDGKNVSFQPLRDHPGFPHETLVYHIASDSWETQQGPFSRATAPVAAWDGGFVIPNGEVRPRVRTPEVWFARPER